MLPPVAESVPFWSRLGLAWQVLIGAGHPALPPAPADPSPTAALQLLGLLQREGRLVDFLQQDVTTFSDAEVGAAARVVHAGCRKALLAHATVVPVREEAEGSTVEVAAVDPPRIKLTGNVQGAPPYRGVLRHRGWRAERFDLPRPIDQHDFTILAPAEVEL
jgi:hypothetical protein